MPLRELRKLREKVKELEEEIAELRAINLNLFYHSMDISERLASVGPATLRQIAYDSQSIIKNRAPVIKPITLGQF